MHYAASHHKLDIGNAFWSVSCNIPDCRAHRVHELLMNNYIDDIPRLWEQRKNKILFMDQVFNTTCIMIKWWRQTLSKSVMIAMAGAIPELVASRSSRRRRSLQSQDQITKWNWDENPLFSRRKNRPVVEIDVPKFPKIFLVGVLPASLSHVVPGQDSISFPIFGILSSEIRKIINTATFFPHRLHSFAWQAPHHLPQFRNSVNLPQLSSIKLSQIHLLSHPTGGVWSDNKHACMCPSP